MARGSQVLQGGHRVLRLLGIQAPLDAAQELRMESGPMGLDLAWGQGGKEGSSGWSHKGVLWLDGGRLTAGLALWWSLGMHRGLLPEIKP